MAKIDVYLRSIEKFGAAGATLSSGQAVALKFPTGDRHATQVTQHEQLVAIVKEIAPAPMFAQLEQNQPARFEITSGSTKYTLSVAPKPGAWQLAIEPAAVAAGSPAPAPMPPPPIPSVPKRATAVAPEKAPEPTQDLPIERTPYPAAEGKSGSAFLDALTAAARAVRATDVYLASGAAPLVRAGGELQPQGDAVDAETLTRELGIVAPPEIRAAWAEKGAAVFAYSDGGGRVRAVLARDQRGPCASLRLLAAEPSPLDRLGIAREVAAWLDRRGLVLVTGASGAGKTTTLAALVRGLAGKVVIAFEDPIEIVQRAPTVSQRAIGVHVPSLAAGVAAAMREGPDAIVIGNVASAEAAGAVLDAVAGGHLVLAALAAGSARDAANTLVDLLPYDRRELAREVLQRVLVGTIAPVLKAGGRAFEVVAGRVE